MIFNYRTDHQNFHYTSFALSFDDKILKHPGFLKFWKNFALTNKKKRIVRRGEIGLTDWVLKQGFTHGETMGVQRVEKLLNALEETRLRDIAKIMIVIDDTQMQQVKNNLKGKMETLSRAEITSYILSIVARQGSSYALAPFSVFELGFPFLKKSPFLLSQGSFEN